MLVCSTQDSCVNAVEISETSTGYITMEFFWRHSCSGRRSSRKKKKKTGNSEL